MARPKFIHLAAQSPARFRPLLGADYPYIEAVAAGAREEFEGRAIWHFSSTFRGGGVAEMLRTLLPYARGAGVDTRWVVLRESAEFFALTKRLHNNLHGATGDGGPLGAGEQRLYERSLAASSRHFARLVHPDDVVFLHDPQTAGLVPAAKRAGATVIWRCHIGCDEPNEVALAAQRFLEPWVAAADHCVFSRQAYVWQALSAERVWTLPPSIDPLSPKNQEFAPKAVAEIVGAIGLGAAKPHHPPRFVRADQTPGRVERLADVLQDEPLPEGARLVAQISRWDRLKDHLGLLHAFATHLRGTDLHLLLAGPSTAAIADDPEGSEVWAQVREAWRGLPDEVRQRVHLACLPMDDLDENGAIVNALQRRANVIVQKSVAEGFGLTVAEAMWKQRPVVGACVGGIQDQIVEGECGLLVAPDDFEAVTAAIRALADDPVRARRLGRAARERVRERYLGPIRLAEYAQLLTPAPVPG